MNIFLVKENRLTTYIVATHDSTDNSGQIGKRDNKFNNKIFKQPNRKESKVSMV